MIRNLVFLFCGIIFFTSCSYFDPEEPVPSYVHIEKINLTGTYTNHPFVDAWFYIDGIFMGVYEVPVTFPVLAEGSHHISIKAGIKVNGLSSSRAAYPLLVKYDTTVSFVAGNSYNLLPKVRYKSNIVTAWYEDFESITHDIYKTQRSDTSVMIIDSVFNSGHQCGGVFLDELRRHFDAYSGQVLDFPRKMPIFLEMTYKCNNTFSVGLYKNLNGQTSVESLVVVYPSNSWKKIYIDLGTPVNQTHEDTRFKLSLAAMLNSGLLKANIYFDDLRIIY